MMMQAVKQLLNSTKKPNVTKIGPTSVNPSKIIVEKFKDNLTPINYSQQKIVSQQTKTYFQGLISKVKATKLFTISFYTGKPIISNNKALSDLSINNCINNFNMSNVPHNSQTDANEAIIFFKSFCVDLRNLCETGSQEEIESFVYEFYSPNNPYFSYFRGEMYNLIKSIHESSTHAKINSISSKDFAYRIYKILDPSFDASSLDNLYIHENISNSKIYQQTHELLDAIDLARSCDVEIHLTNDNDWNQVLKAAKIDSSYTFTGKLSQVNMDILVVDRVNKIYFAIDLKTRFWLRGFPLNTNYLINLGNIPDSERKMIALSQTNELLKNLRNKLNSPNTTNDQKIEIQSQINAISNGDVPLNTSSAMLPHIQSIKSSAVFAVIYSNGSPDRKNVPLGLVQEDITNVIT